LAKQIGFKISERPAKKQKNEISSKEQKALEYFETLNGTHAQGIFHR